MHTRSWSTEPWHGRTKIILGIDLGTTQSSVSFAHLFDGAPQTVQYVTKWPGQPDQSKIPTVVYYDQQHKAVCFGAEALKLENRDRAQDEGWFLAKHFKLHLHPQSMKTKEKLALHPLPPGVPLATIYTDFLDYLLRHTRSYFEKYVVGGDKEWKKHSPNMQVVLCHPNGWTTREQHFLRQALRNVGDNYQSCDVSFVTEAEASVHFCMFHSSLSSSLQPDTNLVVCDAGGSTVDTTAYYVEQTVPTLTLKESKASACVQAGGLFVDLELKRYLTRILTEAGISEEEVEDYVYAGVEDFEASAKKEFVSPDTPHFINLNDGRLNKPQLGIRRGRMSLSGPTVAEFFNQSVLRTTQSIRQQIKGLRPKHLLLVGGFGQSEYLRREVLDEFASGSCEVTVIDAPTSKAAADGAVIWAAKLAVKSRVTRVAYGTTMCTTYDSSNPEHCGRKVTRDASGEDLVSGRWSEIVGQGVSFYDQESLQKSYCQTYQPNEFSRSQKSVSYVWTYCGDPNENPGWVQDKDGNLNPGFEQLCKLEADLSEMEVALRRRQGLDGPYDQLSYSIVIVFGGTELGAHFQWMDNGTTQRGPVSIIPEPVDHHSSGPGTKAGHLRVKNRPKSASLSFWRKFVSRGAR